MPVLPLYNIQGKKVEDMQLPEVLFGGTVKKDIIYQAVVKYQNSRRQGTVNTKERSDVSGGGKKPYRQKGTGRARAGSTRSPLWRGGGTTFGPHPRDFNYTLPQKIRRAALRESLNAKLQNNNVVCINRFEDTLQKTKDFANILKNLKIEGKVLGIVGKEDADIRRISRNIPRFRVVRAEDVNALDIMAYRKVLVTESAMKSLLQRIS